MKLSRVFLLFSLLTFLLSSFSPFTRVCRADELSLEKVTDNIYMIPNYGGTVVFLVTDDGVLVVDATMFPYRGEEIVAKIRHVTDKDIKYLIYTHYHGDHIQGAQGFPPSTVIIAHSNTRRDMERFGLSRIEADKTKYFPEQLKEAEQKVEKLKNEGGPKLNESKKELKIIQKRIKDYERLRLVYPDITIEEKAVIHLGGHRVELLYMGIAHTDGDIMVYFPDEKVIHMGDLLYFPGEEEKRLNIKKTLESVAKMEPDEINDLIRITDNWIEILKKVAAMEEVEKVIPGHGRMADKKSLIARAEHLKKLNAQIQKYISN